MTGKLTIPIALACLTSGAGLQNVETLVHHESARIVEATDYHDGMQEQWNIRGLGSVSVASAFEVTSTEQDNAAPTPNVVPVNSIIAAKYSNHSNKKAPHKRAYITTLSAEDNALFDKIHSCESPGKWNTNTGNGFYGGLQFTQSSWKFAEGVKRFAPRADFATEFEQKIAAVNLKEVQGLIAWPACTERLNLR